jgi:ribosomal protein S18 acetylase RimI-like enzyme
MIEIRKLKKNDDTSDLISLSREFFEEFQINQNDFSFVDSFIENDVIKYFSKFVDTDEKTAFIALDDLRIIGYITVYISNQSFLWKTKNVGAISGLVVKKEYRHRGIGKKLFEAAVSYFGKMQVSHFTVYTTDKNARSIEFYEHNGMEPLCCNYIGKINQADIE